MARDARVDSNCDFQQIALPLNLAIGEHVLQRARLEANSGLNIWYELYLVLTPTGFLIEKHSGSSSGQGRLKETWHRQTLPDAKRKFSQIYKSKLNNNRQNSKKQKVVSDENQGQQELFA